MKRAALLGVFLFACGGSSGTSTPDAAPTPDAEVIIEPDAAPAPPAAENMVIVAGYRDCNNAHPTCAATAAALHIPVKLAFSAGALFVKEFDGGPALRKITLGASPTAEKLFFSAGPDPFDMGTGYAFDAAGNMFVIEGYIWRVDLATRSVTMCAGDGSINYAEAITDAQGNLYFAQVTFGQTFTNEIKVLEKTPGDDDLCHGTIRTVAGGDGTQGYNGDDMPAIDAQVWGPAGMVFDADGNFYFADDGNHRVRRIDLQGTITTVAGTGEMGDGGDAGDALQAQFSTLRGLAYDGAGHLLIADQGARRVRRLDLTNGLITAYPLMNGALPWDGDVSNLAIDEGGNLYVTQPSANRVLGCDSAGACQKLAGVETPALPAPAAVYPLTDSVDLECDEASGDCYLENGWGAIYRLAADGTLSVFAGTPGNVGDSTDGGKAEDTTFGFLSWMTRDAESGDIYLVQHWNGAASLRKIDGATHIVSTLAGNGSYDVPQDGQPALGGPLPDVQGLVVYDGALYVSLILWGDMGPLDNRIVTIGSDGIVHTVANAGGALGYCEDTSVTGSSAAESCLAGPGGLAFDERTGELVFVEIGTHMVRKIDATGALVTVAGDGFGMVDQDGLHDGRFQGDGGPATQASLSYPIRPLVAANGDVYITDNGNNVVRKVDARTGVITTVAGAPPGETDILDEGGLAPRIATGAPEDLALDGAGNLYVTQGFHGGNPEDLVWRVNLDVDVSATSGLSLDALAPTLSLAYTSEAGDPAAGITAQLIDDYGLRGGKIIGGDEGAGETFDLKAEVAAMRARGLQPTHIRVETRTAGGRWITGDLQLPSQ